MDTNTNMDIDLATDLDTDKYMEMAMYGVCLLNFRKISIKREQLQIEARLFLAYFSLRPGDVDVFFAAL